MARQQFVWEQFRNECHLNYQFQELPGFDKNVHFSSNESALTNYSLL